MKIKLQQRIAITITTILLCGMCTLLIIKYK